MSAQINDGGPAFPVGTGCYDNRHGMTLRDWFAGQALAGMGCRWDSIKASLGEDGDNPFEVRESISYEAYKLADAMIAERNKE